MGSEHQEQRLNQVRTLPTCIFHLPMTDSFLSACPQSIAWIYKGTASWKKMVGLEDKSTMVIAALEIAKSLLLVQKPCECHFPEENRLT